MNEIKLTLTRSQVYTWEDQNQPGSTITWSIALALQIIGDREPDLRMPLEAQRHALTRNTLSSDLDEAYARTTDLTKPLIAVVSPVEFVPGKMVLLIIDGWHRIKHSVLVNNQTPIPVHVLMPDEEETCRIAAINIQDLSTTD